MNNNMQAIGRSTKAIDRLSIAVSPLVLAIFTLMFLKSGVILYVLATVGGCLGLGILIITSKYYVSYSDGYFLIDHAFKKKKSISSDRYIRVTQTPIDLPFSNTLVIHFRGNEKFRFNGGFQNFRTTDLMIRRLLNEQATSNEGTRSFK